jgi:hypothetical protein
MAKANAKGSKRVLLTAVVHANPKKLAKAGVEASRATPHLAPAGESLRGILEKSPDSELSRHIRGLLDEEKLFYVVGPWPPRSVKRMQLGDIGPWRVGDLGPWQAKDIGPWPGIGKTTGISPVAAFCRHCGKPNP